MARAAVTPAEVPAPRANPYLVGHEAAEGELRRLAEAGRLPHAILVSGPRGIGKATLAFRLARFLRGGRSSRRFGCSGSEKQSAGAQGRDPENEAHGERTLELGEKHGFQNSLC